MNCWPILLNSICLSQHTVRICFPYNASVNLEIQVQLVYLKKAQLIAAVRQDYYKVF